MTLYEKILAFYPSLNENDFVTLNKFGSTILLQNNGQGDYIAKWEHPTLAKPTDEELA